MDAVLLAGVPWTLGRCRRAGEVVSGNSAGDVAGAPGGGRRRARAPAGLRSVERGRGVSARCDSIRIAGLLDVAAASQSLERIFDPLLVDLHVHGEGGS